MNKTNNVLVFFVCLCFLLSSCSESQLLPPSVPPADNQNMEEKEEIPAEEEEEYTDPGDEPLEGDSQDLNLDNMVKIHFSADSVVVSNPLEDEVSIEYNGNHLVINSSTTSREVNYVLSGNTADGSVKIYGTYKFGLYLNGVEIVNPNGAAVNIQCKKKTIVTVVDNTSNRLTDGETYIYYGDEDMKGTFFSEGQLLFTGNGLLEIRGKNKHAICSDDYIQIYEGDIWVKEAASDAIHANDYIIVSGGAIQTRSVGEGLDSDRYIHIAGGSLDITTTGQKGHGINSIEYVKVENNPQLTVKTEGTASKCIKSDGNISISGGKIDLKTTGSACYDAEEKDTSSPVGVKAGGNINIDKGDISIWCSGAGGKGMSATGELVVNNGNISVTTTGAQYSYSSAYKTAAKAIKSTGNLTINGGNIYAKTYQSEAEGIESKATLAIAGGTVEVEAYDDCLNASKHIEISGGNVYCKSSANDAIDSNGTLTIAGGVVVACGATQPEAAFDCDQNRFSITGGTIVGIGGDTSTPTSSYCSQPSLVYKTSTSINTIAINNSSTGANVLVFEFPRTYSSMTMLFSSPSLQTSTAYSILINGTITSTESAFHGLYANATYTNGTSANTFTTGSSSGSVTSVGTNGIGGGGRPR
ncbi:carbohydrate-binding domain-containing protein [Paludibacter sp. 221]|uniref:carbohydrate-binding domain-containing protein n=1 Tax=Paludibacter sp. 221 TaxID=2302939 RepID=UPI0013D467C2|nr:carbohydrate-binding domain-containing protein [Paludibacter sp. 221]NDV46755.1 carbohydrate-binding domain-containing protein [Paludibacter sp. 221]